jgi:hypothetical protein
MYSLMAPNATERLVGADRGDVRVGEDRLAEERVRLADERS